MLRPLTSHILLTPSYHATGCTLACPTPSLTRTPSPTQAFSVRITPEQIPQLPQLLRAIPAARVAAMQTRLAEVKRRYLLHPFSTALSLIGLRARVALAERDEAAHKLGAT